MLVDEPNTECWWSTIDWAALMVVVNNWRFVFGEWIMKRSLFGVVFVLPIWVIDVWVMIVSVFLLGVKYLGSVAPDAHTTRVIAGCLTGEFVEDDDVEACDVIGLGVRLIIRSDGIAFWFANDVAKQILSFFLLIKNTTIATNKKSNSGLIFSVYCKYLIKDGYMVAGFSQYIPERRFGLPCIRFQNALFYWIQMLYYTSRQCFVVSYKQFDYFQQFIGMQIKCVKYPRKYSCKRQKNNFKSILDFQDKQQKNIRLLVRIM